MATRVELRKEMVRDCIDMSIASNRRAMNSSKNPQFAPIYESILKELTDARNTLTDTK